MLLAVLLAAAALEPCPADLAKLRPAPGETVRCGTKASQVRARAHGVPAPYAGWTVIRLVDPAPLRLGAGEEVRRALVNPGGEVRTGADLTDPLREGKIPLRSPEEAATVIVASLLGAYETVHGPAAIEDPAARELARRLAHLPAPSVRRTEGGGYEVLAYGRSRLRFPKGAEQETIDRVRARLVPTAEGWAIETDVGRIFERGVDATGAHEGWRPGFEPTATPLPKP